MAGAIYNTCAFTIPEDKKKGPYQEKYFYSDFGNFFKVFYLKMSFVCPKDITLKHPECTAQNKQKKLHYNSTVLR